MGGVDDEHGPAVGDDFVYSTGLTTAGTRGQGRRLGRRGVRGCEGCSASSLSRSRPPLPTSLSPFTHARGRGPVGDPWPQRATGEEDPQV